jgi:hypothetical protein
MSLEAVAWALRQPVQDAKAKLMLISLADHHNASTGLCCPSRALLAEAAVCDERTVKRKLADLVEQGWITVEARFCCNGRQTSNSYRLRMAENLGGRPVPLPTETAEKVGGQDVPLPRETSNIVPLVGDTALPPSFLNRNRNQEGAGEREPLLAERMRSCWMPGGPSAEERAAQQKRARQVAELRAAAGRSNSHGGR